MQYYMQTLILWLVRHGGFNALDNKIKEFLSSIQHPEKASSPLVAHRRMNNFFNRLKLVLPAQTFEEYYSDKNSFLILGDDGKAHRREGYLDDPASYAFYSATLAEYRKRIDDLEAENARLRNLHQVSIFESVEV